MKLHYKDLKDWTIELEKDTGILNIGSPVNFTGDITNLVFNIPVVVQVDKKGNIHGLFIELLQYEFKRVFKEKLSS